MGRRGNPYDNAKAESFMKTLKVEEGRTPISGPDSTPIDSPDVTGSMRRRDM